MEKSQLLDISWEAILKIFAAIFIFYFIYLTKEIALWFFFGLAISVLLEPAINFLRRIHVPKIIAILLMYISIFGLLGVLIYITAPIFISELKEFSAYLPDYFLKISPVLRQLGVDAASSFGDFTEFFVGELQESSKGILSAVVTFLGGVSSALFILVTAFFLSLEDRAPERFLKLIIPRKYEDQVVTFFETAQKKVAGWFGARILACLFVGVASYVIFYIFDIEYAFLLALISAVLNFIPYIGPWITAILLAVFTFASSSSIMTVVYVLAAVLIVQFIENGILTPLLMKKLIDLPPVLVVISLLVGAKLFGFLGIIFAVPVFGIIYEFTKEFLEKRRDGENDSD
jgi:predicted PurR-regulated permease PerM